jgi:hypothetical protein
MEGNKPFIKNLEAFSKIAPNISAEELGFGEDNKALGNKASVFALKLENAIAVNVDDYSRNAVITQHLKSQVDLINSLYNAENKFSYDLRFISRKSEIFNAEKELDIALLVKTVGSIDEEAEKEALAHSQIVPLLLSSRLPYHEFKLVEDEAEFNSLYNPFNINNLAEIRRRYQLIPLATLNKGASAGLLPQGGGAEPSEYVHYVYPFIPHQSDFKNLINLLLSVKQNLILSCLLVPTLLEEKEINFINDQIAKCEKARLSYSEGSHSYRLRADSLLLAYEEQLSKLLDAPFLMQIRLASDEPFVRALLEAIGVEISEYQSSLKNSFYSGGYDVLWPESDEERQKVAICFKDLMPLIWGHPADFGRWRFLFDGWEAISAFRLPLAIGQEMVGLRVNFVKSLPIPKEVKALINSGKPKVKIGLHLFEGKKSDVFISEIDRLRHVYVVGQTGTGKTTLLKRMILEDIVNGNGLVMIDPHGDLFNEVCGLIPENRIEDVVILDPTDMEYPVGLNLLEYQTREEKFFIIKEIQEIMRRLLEDEYGTAVGEFAGPLFFHLVEMALLLIMDDPSKKVTIYDFYEFFQNNENWKKWKRDKYTEDDLLRDWVNNQLPDMDFTGRSSGTLSLGEYVYGKFKDFIFDPKLRNIFKQEISTIDFRRIMNEGKILLVNLAKGELSQKNSRFLGMVIMSKIMSTALERIKCPKEKRRTFYVYVDEFQNIATSSFVVLLSEARKFGLGLVLANQFLWQIKNPQIREAIFGNVSNIISFRVGLEDAKMLDDIFLPTINANDLINLPNWQAAVRTSVDGRITSPFYIRTELAREPNEETGHRIRERSREKYGRRISE